MNNASAYTMQQELTDCILGNKHRGKYVHPVHLNELVIADVRDNIIICHCGIVNEPAQRGVETYEILKDFIPDIIGI